MPRLPKFYLDTHIAKVVAIQLRAKNIEILRCEEVGLGEADDDVHLAYAGEHGYTLVTQDGDFTGLHTKWLEEGKSHAGILIAPSHLRGEAQISYIVKEIVSLIEMIATGAGTFEQDIENHIIFL